MDDPLVNSRDYYLEYFGHDVRHLRTIHASLRQDERSPQPRQCIFLAGDSSLDNKVWFEARSEAVNGYEHVLRPPHMKLDVCYWMNREAVRRGLDAFCLNTAVEATALNQRACCCLLEQDRLISECITSRDVLIVSIGGNDVALAPVLATILNIIPLLCCTPVYCIDHCACACPPNLKIDTGCAGCGAPGCLVSPFGFPPGLAYFVDLFGHRVENYVRRVLGSARPQKVVVCMYYFLDVHGRGSWADCFLMCMCYNIAPWRLQAALRKVFELATRRIRIPGVEVIPFALFDVLDGEDTRDYVQRVEPSPQGGRKMALALMDAIYGPADGLDDDESGGSSGGAPHEGSSAEDGLVLRRMRRD